MKQKDKEVKIQWHSYFGQVMEKVCTRRNFLVEREEEVGQMPLRIDLIVIRKQDIEYSALESPYIFFNDINIIEFKSRSDVFDWCDLYQLELYGRLYAIIKKIAQRSRVSLWSVSSHFTEKYRDSLEEVGFVLEEIDSGFFRGKNGGFDCYEMDLTDLPFKKAYYPFHLFGKNEEHIRNLIEIAIDNPEETQDYNKEMLYLYGKTYKEVLFMKLLNPLEAGCDEEGLKELFLGEPFCNILLPKWVDEIIDKLGKDNIISKLGEDEITKILIKKLGKDKLLKLVDKISNEEI